MERSEVGHTGTPGHQSGIDQSLNGVRVVEAASFIAAPICALSLAQLGAEVIRIDNTGGGPDFDRWPLAKNGASYYWEGLNKGKRSVAINLRSGEGRELATALITAERFHAPIFVTNFPEDGFLSHERLRQLRPDLLSVRVTGWADGRSAFDYTVNAAVGLPFQTGSPDLPAGTPVNAALPAWDFITGHYAATAAVAGHYQRLASGHGAEIRVPLGSIGLATMGHLGQIAEAIEEGRDRPRYGNDVFGTFGRDFTTADDRKLIIVAITPPQWRDLVRALDITAQIDELEAELGVEFTASGGTRFLHRDRLFAIVAPAIRAKSATELNAMFSGTRVCWGPYKLMTEALEDPRLASVQNPLFDAVTHASGSTYPTPRTPAFTVGAATRTAPSAPRLGADTHAILSDTLGLTQLQISRLIDRGTIACA